MTRLRDATFQTLPATPARSDDYTTVAEFLPKDRVLAFLFWNRRDGANVSLRELAVVSPDLRCRDPRSTRRFRNDVYHFAHHAFLPPRC
jgi:hypothetical protein